MGRIGGCQELLTQSNHPGVHSPTPAPRSGIQFDSHTARIGWSLAPLASSCCAANYQRRCTCRGLSICMQSRRSELSSRQMLNVTLPRRRRKVTPEGMPPLGDLYRYQKRSPLARICQNLPSPKRHHRNVFSPYDPRIPRILPRQAHDIGCVPGEHQQQQQGASNRIRGRGRCLAAPDSELKMSNSRHAPDTIA